MDFGDLTDPRNLAEANLCKIRYEHPGMCYCDPYSAEWYSEQFPGLPMECFGLLAQAGPIEPPAAPVRRRRTRGGRRVRARRERKMLSLLPAILDMPNSDDSVSE